MATHPGTSMDVHFKVFGTDGVSLQSQELTSALRKRGWRVHLCASDVPDGAEGLRLPELSYQSDDARATRRALFGHDPDAGRAGRVDLRPLLDRVEERAGIIRRRIEEYADGNDIRLLHVRNITSLPFNLAATLAVHQLVERRPDLHFVLHHHDLYWEGPNAVAFQTPHPEVADLVARTTCPNRPNTTHVLINPLAARALKERRGIDAAVIPDGFDFDREVAATDEDDFRTRLEVLTGNRTPVGPDDLVVAMPARVAVNKAIELAIQFVAGLERRRPELEDAPAGLGPRRRRLTARGRIVLLLVQGEDVDESRGYLDRLVAYAAHSGVTVAYGGRVVVADRTFVPGDRAHFPFYGHYRAVDVVCYPPEHEGFGNQVIEAVWAKRPLAVLEYPVFEAFVRDHIPHYISLGNVAGLGRLEGFGGLHLIREDVLRRALDAAVMMLRDQELMPRWLDENAASLRRFCGIETVSEQFVALYERAGRASAVGLSPGPG